MSKQAVATAEGGNIDIKAKDKQRKFDSRSITKFVTQVHQEGKLAFDLFRDKALQSGLYKATDQPLPHIHRNYYDKYIKSTHNGSRFITERSNSQVNTPSYSRGNARSVLQTTQHSRKLETYIPLRDLLRHNHEERVQGYLKQLNEDEERELAIAKLKKNQVQVEDVEQKQMSGQRMTNNNT